MTYLKHPAWLWLKKHDPSKLPPVSDKLQAIFDTGNAFEPYAESLFPGGVRLGFDNYEEYKTLPERTLKALEDGATTIFQGRFEYEDRTFICDIIELVDDKTVDLYEIKSSSSAKPDHEIDLAFQTIVLEGCGFEVRNIAVVHVNSQYVRHGDIDAKGLTEITDITEKVKDNRELVAEQSQAAIDMLNSGVKPDLSPTLASKDAFREWLDIYKHLMKVEPDSIYNLYQLTSKQLADLEDAGINLISDIPDDFKLKTKQALYLETSRSGRPIIKRDSISEFLSGFEYPLYFFDYETLSSLVPYFDGLSPYQNLPFQYSLHILDSPDADLRHAEYLHKENSNIK